METMLVAKGDPDYEVALSEGSQGEAQTGAELLGSVPGVGLSRKSWRNARLDRVRPRTVRILGHQSIG